MKDFLAFVVVLIVSVCYLWFVAMGGSSQNKYKIKTVNGWKTRDAGDIGPFVVVFLTILILATCSK